MSYHLLWWFLIFQSSQSAWLSPQLYFFFAALGEVQFLCVENSAKFAKLRFSFTERELVNCAGSTKMVQGYLLDAPHGAWAGHAADPDLQKVFLGSAKLVLVKMLWCMMQPNVMFFIYIYSIFCVYIYYIFLRHDRHGNSETATLDLGIEQALLRKSHHHNRGEAKRLPDIWRRKRPKDRNPSLKHAGSPEGHWDFSRWPIDIRNW